MLDTTASGMSRSRTGCGADGVAEDLAPVRGSVSGDDGGGLFLVAQVHDLVEQPPTSLLEGISSTSMTLTISPTPSARWHLAP